MHINKVYIFYCRTILNNDYVKPNLALKLEFKFQEGYHHIFKVNTVYVSSSICERRTLNFLFCLFILKHKKCFLLYGS
jgi:hypothetical protein